MNCAATSSALVLLLRAGVLEVEVGPRSPTASQGNRLASQRRIVLSGFDSIQTFITNIPENQARL